MYLKALEIQGFKSFPEKTRLTFEKNITAIVGPNGSGKSNISDAILWVMGEQRTKALRGGKMEDVIFGGTEKRDPMGFAQVSLIIDNTGRFFDMDASEVMITRRYYRSGESEYYLNRETVRLRDITELLMDTGLGREGYSIIGQGRIADIVSAKSGERREIFEEAAGISRFRHRKEDAERKLGRTEENLLRINDKIEVMESQVGPLREQSEVAKRYLILRDELRQTEVSLWMDTLERLKVRNETIETDYENAQIASQKARDELSALYAETENLSEAMRRQDVLAETARGELSRTEAAVSECKSAVAVFETNLKNSEDSEARLRREFEEQETRAQNLAAQIEAGQRRMAEIDEEKAQLELAIGEVGRVSAENDAEGDETRRQLAALLLEESALAEAAAGDRATLSALAETLQGLMDRESALMAQAGEAREKFAQAGLSLKAARAARDEAEEKLTELSNIVGGYSLRLQGREQKLEALSAAVTKLTVDLRSADGRIAMLREMEKEFEGFSRSVKTVMREKDRGSLRGVHGPVASLLKTEDRFALAIETALGGAMQNIVVDDPESGKAAIELLKSRDAGRATFLPLKSIRGGGGPAAPKGDSGCLGSALELIAFDEAYRSVFESLLNRTLISETLSDAIRLAKKYDNRFKIVSLDGQVVNMGGSMTGGSSAKGAGILSRANELKRLEKDRETLHRQHAERTAELTEAQRERDAVKYELEVARTEQAAAGETAARRRTEAEHSALLLEAAEEAVEALGLEAKSAARQIEETRVRSASVRGAITGAEEKLAALKVRIETLTAGRDEFEKRRETLAGQIAELKSQIASLSATREATYLASEQLGELLAALSGDSGARLSAMDDIETRKTGIVAQLEEKRRRLAELTATAERQRNEITAANAARLNLEGRRTKTEKAAQTKNRDLLDAERLAAAIEQKKLAAEMEEKQIIDKLWDSYELSRTAALAMAQPIQSAQAATKEVSRLKREITSLGTPNLGAIEEYARVKEKYDFMTGQRDDVQKAKNELTAIISSITKEMKDIFVRQLENINQSFKSTFTELFGGGKASLELEDENDVLGCGIEIKVQPPGKALSSLSLLSGGETAFVAIALYFAILKVSPTPFCVMDEIEAALDEVNVAKYAEHMRRVSDKTQFLVITHRRGTMEEADLLYGVTMEEKGVSKVIAMDVSEAEKAIYS